MRKLRSNLVVSVVAAAFLFAVPSAASTVFFDDFQSGASPLWGEESGVWSDAGGVYSDTTSGFSHSSLPFDLSDFVIELDINAAHDGGIFLRSDFNSGLFNGVTLITGGLGGGGTGLYWHIWVDGNSGAALNLVDGLFSQGDDLHVRIEVVGDTYSAFLGDSTVPITTLTTDMYSSGQVAVFNNAVGQSFDNVSLAPIPIPPTALLLISAIGSLFFGRGRTDSKA